MFSKLIAGTAEIVDGKYPGGASADDPVPENIAYYGTDWTYGGIMLLALLALLFMVTRLNADR